MRTIHGVEYLTATECAASLGVHPRTVKRWLEKRAKNDTVLSELQYFRHPITRYWYFDKNSVENFVKKEFSPHVGV